MKKYWRSLDEYKNIPEKPEENFENEHKNAVLGLFDEDIVSAKSSRRDFLKLLGFSVTSAALAASCERPVHKAIPYVIQPEEIIPGKSLHYASGFFDGKDYCPIVVKTREGRPVKIEGNELSPFNQGSATARVQASVLSLYDDARLKTPTAEGNEISWEELDSHLLQSLQKSDKEGKQVVLLTSTIISPTTKKLIGEFGRNHSNFKWISYDPVSVSALRKAYGKAYGVPMLPSFNIEKAKVLLAVNADFLGSWIAPVNFIRQYANARKPDPVNPEMLRHYQVESGMTLSGSNADHRYPALPSEEKIILANLYNKLAEGSGRDIIETPDCSIDLDMMASDLREAGKAGLVLCGSNDAECQLISIAINELLGSECVDMNSPLNILQGSDMDMEKLVEDMNAGKTGTLLMHNVNPLYDYHDHPAFLAGMKKTGLCISMPVSRDETGKAADLLAPVSHYLESWDDAEIYPGHLSLAQPCIHPVFNTRSFQDSLLKWMGSEKDYHNYLRDSWEENYFDGSGRFIDFWNECLRDGILIRKISGEWKLKYKPASLIKKVSKEDAGQGFELCLTESVSLGDGRHANNPWLQELPDPVTKLCWDSALQISPADADEMELVNGSIVKLNEMFTLPVLIQPGQAKGSLTLPLGYGREYAGKVAEGLGVNAFQLVKMLEDCRSFTISGIKLESLGEVVDLALTQTHNSMEGRPIVRESNLDEYIENRHAGNELHEEYESHHKTLYPDVEYDGFHWGLAVDLNACVGCSSCMIACQAENNIPVVGKDEVFRRRIMHWIKIDRYYSDEPDNPKVAMQPVMCQHCDNAPCENVCPVSATNHSSEGLNQMAYNRCVGTKYCINNCPYRARRFNWYKYASNDEFDYNMNSDLGKMVLNPDVTVRSRGVVEKCSFCVQRIQEKKLEAKMEGRQLKDGEIQPACVQTCPAGALVFGNLNDKNSKISKMFANERNYHLLEELHTLPSVGYLTRIRNEKKDDLS